MADEFADLGPDFHQNISLTGKEHAHTIHGFQVNIYPSKLSAIGEVDCGSSKVKISTVTNQNWERPVHHGKMVASNNKYLSYVLEGRNGYVLRLIQQGTNNRALLKGFVGAIVDVAFCHANSNLLACVDEGGNLHIWDLDKSGKDESKVQMECLKIVIQRSSEPDNIEHRLVWSPYVPPPDEEEEQEICNIVLTHGSDIEVLDIHEIFSTYSSGMRVPRDKLCCGCYSIPGAHKKSIHDLSLSPDGSVLATVAKDGHLKFWQVSWEKDEDKPPECLHDFVPHKGAAVTRLIFCDNHLSQDPSNQYWRFLITAAKNNTEVKIWCAVSWKCLQTIRFLPPGPDPAGDRLTDLIEPHIRLNLDLSASYLVVADSSRKAVLVLQLFTSTTLGDASVTSVTEYLLTQPILSFTVLDFTRVRALADHEESSGGESEEEEDWSARKTLSGFDSRRNAVLLKLHCVQTRSMQELLVRFEPPDISGVPPSKEDLNIVAPIMPNDGFPSHVSPQPASLPTNLVDTPQFQNTPPTTFHSLPPFNSSPKLLTPSQFKSPVKTEVEFITQLPLLSPASIVASVTSNQPTPDSTASIEQANASLMQQSSSEEKDLFSATQGTLTSVTSNFDVADPESVCSGPQDTDILIKEENGGGGDEVSGERRDEEIQEVGNRVEELSEGVVAKQDEDFVGEVTLSAPPGLEAVSDEDESPSAEEAKKAFDNIMDMLSVEKSEAAALQPAKPSFEEFTELLDNPGKLQEHERELEAMDEMVNSPEGAAPKEDTKEDEPSEAVTSTLANSTSSFPDVVKPATFQEPLQNDAKENTETKEVERAASNGLEAQWPDIGAPEVLNNLAENVYVQPDADNVMGAAPSEVQNEVYIADSEPPDVGLLMPSALTDVPVEISNVAPDLLDQDASAEAKWALESEEGAVKVKSKPRKRSKKKKQANGAVASAGVAEVIDAPSHSDSDAVLAKAAAVDLLPSMETDEASNEKDILISHLVKLVSEQHQMLRELKSEQQRQFLSLEDQVVRVRSSVLEEQNAALAEMKMEQQQKFDRVLKDKQTMDKQKQDKLITTLSSTLTTAVHAKLDKLVKVEMKNNVLPVIQQSLSSLHEELSGKISHSLTATDVAMKDGINRLISSKELPNAVETAVTTSLHRTLPIMCEEIFKTLVLTSFERSCQEMFKQVDQAFRRGTMEYLSQLQQQQHNMQESTLQYLLSSLDSMQSVLGKSLEYSAPTHLQSVVHQEVVTLSHHIKAMLTEVVSEAVHKEIGSVMEAQASQKAQLAESKKEQVKKFVQDQNYNSAFELALSTSDLQLVTYLCQQADPEDLFDKSPCPLTQPVLLSLIQQLSVNLEENLELKLKYLDQCLLALDSKDEVTKNHMVPVIRQLTQQMSIIQKKVQKDPSMATAGVTKQIRRLLLCAQQLCS